MVTVQERMVVPPKIKNGVACGPAGSLLFIYPEKMKAT